MLRSVLVEKQRADAAARDDDVTGTAVLELVRVGHALLGRLDVHVEDATYLMVVGLDEEGVCLDGLHEELAGSVDDELDSTSAKPLHDLNVHVLGKRAGDGAGEHEGVARIDDIHALEELVDLLLRDLRAHAVDHRHDDAVELDVDTREATVELDEVARDAVLLELADEVVTGEARHDAHCDVDDVELVEKRGDVDAVSTAVELFVRRPVREAHVQRQWVHDIIKGGV